MDVDVLDSTQFGYPEAPCHEAEERSGIPKRPRIVPATFLRSYPPQNPPSFLLYNGPITYLTDALPMERAADYIFWMVRRGLSPAVGFDIEWKVTYATGQPPNRTALIQLCFLDPNKRNPDQSPPYHCYLMHVHHCGGIVPANLAKLLTSEEIPKSGVGIHNDSLKIMKDFGVEMKGLVDLSEVANTRLCDAQGRLYTSKWSLDALTEKVLGGKVRKLQTVRCGDWEQAPLTENQRLYAATDAWLSLRLHIALHAMPVKEQPQLQPVEPSSLTQTPDSCIIPPCFTLGHLQPAKHAALTLHIQGKRVAEIAEGRGIKEYTVLSYLGEAILAGHQYDLGRLKLKEVSIRTAAEWAEQVLGLERPLRREMDLRDEDLVRLSKKHLPFNMLAEIQSRKGMRQTEMQAELEKKVPGLNFGEIRLALAHLARCNPEVCEELREAKAAAAAVAS